MKYKIGEVSKILNIPVETIRFYETKNLLHPQKDENSNYRYYDVWDINLLLDYKKYRDLEQRGLHLPSRQPTKVLLCCCWKRLTKAMLEETLLYVSS